MHVSYVTTEIMRKCTYRNMFRKANYKGLELMGVLKKELIPYKLNVT
jgi:hypothetical protein